MYHSITFTIDSATYNTWDNWRLIPVKRPHVGPPEQEIMYQNELQYEPLDLTLPGQFGILKQRQASWQFAVYNDYAEYNWATVYSNVMMALQGKIGTFYFEDDPSYFYRGRFHVSEWDSGESYSTITIEAECEPYKYSGDRQSLTKRAKRFTFNSSTNQPTPCNLHVRLYANAGTLKIYGLQRSKLTGNEFSTPLSINNAVANYEYQILGEFKELTKQDLSPGGGRYYMTADVSNLYAFPTVVNGSNSVRVVTTNSVSDNDVEIVVEYNRRYL